MIDKDFAKSLLWAGSVIIIIALILNHFSSGSFFGASSRSRLSIECGDPFTIEYPTSTANFERQILRWPGVTTTISSVKVLNKTLGDTVGFNLFIGSNYQDATSSMNAVFTSYQTGNSTTTGNILTPNGSTTINSDQFLMTDVSVGSSTRFILSVCGY